MRTIDLGRAFVLAALLTTGPRLHAGFAGTDVVIPAVARASGAGGSQFTSTLWITNLSDGAASFRILLLRQGQPNPSPLEKSDTLGPRATRRYDDVVQLFGVSGLGAALRIVSDRELFVSSRTYDLPPGTPAKNAKGLFFSGIPASFAIGAGESARLQGVTNGPLESYRYNFGLVETTGQPATVMVTVKDDSGAVRNTEQYLLGAFEARQVNAFGGYQPPVSTTNAVVEAQVVSGAGRVILYGTQIAGTAEDPGSNDSAGFEMSFRSSLLAGSNPAPALTGIFAGVGLTGGGTSGNVTLGIAPGGVGTAELAAGSVTEPKVAPGQVVKSVNGLKDDVTLVGGSSNVTVTTAGSTVTIDTKTGQLALPYEGTADLGTPAFSVSNASDVGIHGTGGSRGVWGEGGTYGVYGNGTTEGVHGQGGPVGVYGDGNPYGVHGNGHKGVHGTGHIGVEGIGAEIGVEGYGGLYGVYGAGDHSGVFGIGSVYGVYSKADFGGAGAKYFVEPHPTDPEKEIRYVALEGPEAGTYFRGSGRTVDGVAVIEVPESFGMVTDERNLTCVVTPTDGLAMVACTEKSLDRIVIESSRDIAFDYVVHGVRKAFKEHEPITRNIDFVPRSADDPNFAKYLPAESVRRLKASGILDEEGRIRVDTAERLGWTRAWAERERALNVRKERP